jgi:hypothetical protein
MALAPNITVSPSFKAGRRTAVEGTTKNMKRKNKDIVEEGKRVLQ